MKGDLIYDMTECHERVKYIISEWMFGWKQKIGDQNKIVKKNIGKILLAEKWIKLLSHEWNIYDFDPCGILG